MSLSIRWNFSGLFLLMVLPAITEDFPHSIRNFSEAKRFAAEVYVDKKETFYCGCGFDTKKRVDVGTCGYVPRKNNKRSQRIEWDHIVPAHALGQSRQCWREPICTNSKGKAYKGRQCCEKVDPVFRAMVSDLRNLVPAIGELNGDRSNFTFSMIEGEPREYGACDFEVDRSLRKAEPRPEVRGDIARTYFYMHETYGLPLSGKQRQLFEVWDREDPLSEWEVVRNARIDSIVQRRRLAMSEGSNYIPYIPSP
jgi:deoxyribonuclease-1